MLQLGKKKLKVKRKNASVKLRSFFKKKNSLKYIQLMLMVHKRHVHHQNRVENKDNCIDRKL